MLKNLKNNENGIVFVTVLMIVVVIMTITIGIIGLNVSQFTFTEKESRRLQAEILAMGAVAYVFANQTTMSASNSIILTGVPMGTTSYTVTANITDNNTGPNGSDPLLIQINY